MEINVRSVTNSAPRRKLNDRCHQQIHRSDPDYWSKRRRWWVEESCRQGTDWPGIARTILEVEAFLRRVRQ